MRLIDADVLMEQMKRRREFVGRASDPVCLVEDAPTIEAEPVRHGHWEESVYRGMLACSECRIYHIPKGDEYDFTYCPHCGAKMDEVSE